MTKDDRQPTLLEHAARTGRGGSGGRAPLADRMRPESLDEILGQEHLLGATRWLRRAIESDRFPSLILWGPPGVGKTTLASVVARVTRRQFANFSAVLGGVAELRTLLKEADENRRYRGQGTVLFIDEIHRFNRSQQDAFLPHVERGTVTLIGATTENPSFSVNAALLSRAKVLALHALTPADIVPLLQRALLDRERGLGELALLATDGALNLIAQASGGDARRALGLLETAALLRAADLDPESDGTVDVSSDRATDDAPDAATDDAPDAATDIAPDAATDDAPDAATDIAPDAGADVAPDAGADVAPDAATDDAPDTAPDAATRALHQRTLTEDSLQELLSGTPLLYDKSGDEHYNVISAFIKSLRGSDPDAAIYWLMRMLEAGEDPLFVLRRMIIFASEDIGNADPRALSVAVAADQAFARMGMPEGYYPIAHACLFLASCPKSGAVGRAFKQARQMIEQRGALPVPKKLRNAPTALMKQEGYGEGYRYAHDFREGFAPGETYLPDELLGTRFYEPSEHGLEKAIKERLDRIEAARRNPQK